VPHQ